MKKSIFVDKIYDYYWQNPVPGIKITKADLKKFNFNMLARGYCAIVNHNICPKVLNILISEKQERIGKKPLIDYLVGFYSQHPTPHIFITENDLIDRDIEELRKAVNSVLNDTFPWLLIDIINTKRKKIAKTVGQLSIF